MDPALRGRVNNTGGKKMTVRTTSSGHSHSGECSVSFSGDKEEIETLERALTSGNFWVRVTPDKRIVESPAYLVPELKSDDKIESYFADGSIIRLDRNPDEEESCTDPSFYVQHITGYDGDYEKRKKIMEDVGFECLRSRRGKDGKIWEIWYLAGAWDAKGEMKDKTTDDIIKYLCQHVGPGTITLGGRQWGLSVD